MAEFLFDPEMGSDDEIEEFNQYKSSEEEKEGLKFSKNAIIFHIINIRNQFKEYRKYIKFSTCR